MPTFVGMTTLCDRASIAAIIRQQCLRSLGSAFRVTAPVNVPVTTVAPAGDATATASNAAAMVPWRNNAIIRTFLLSTRDRGQRQR
ncbi:MAG TPA: hypothetical protein VGG99_15135 [Acetobacteraceae bacterium]|jgi:hypothetical protein